MKKNLLYVFAMLLVVASCKEEEVLDIDINKYNATLYTNTELDGWLMDNITTPYNIEIVYRYDNNKYGGVTRNVGAVMMEQVKPMVEALLKVYIKPYEKIGGATFIKKSTPKEYILGGTSSYNSSSAVILGVAEGNRSTRLYSINSIDFSWGTTNLQNIMRIVHHEFTHNLNAIVKPPVEYDELSQVYYTQSSLSTAAVAKSLGFVSSYSRTNAVEDFAEMSSHLLVYGPVWFNNYVITAPAYGQQILRKKEELVIQYFDKAFGIDFKALQAEVQNALKTNYGIQDPDDLTKNFYIQLATNKVSNITIKPSAAHYTIYGRSATFTTLWNNYKNALGAQTPATNNRYPQSMVLNFLTDSTMNLRINYLNNTQTVSANADYNFSMKVNTANGEVVFSRILTGTGTEVTNGKTAQMLPYFQQYLLPYFVDRVFIAASLPTTITPTNPLYGTYAGFYEKGVTANYFYGPLILK